jgi:translocator protein
MAIAAWIVWKTRPSPCRRRGLRLFCVQLGLNFLWGWIFFDRHQIGTAFADIIVLWVAILLTILTFKKMSTTAAWLLVPYLAWVTFAAYLNFGLWRLNQG